MKTLKLFLLLMVCFSFVSMVQAQSFQTNINTNKGLQIFAPEFEAVKYNTSFELHIHTTNISTGLQVPNSAVSCYLHLYGMDGSYIYQQNSPITKDANGWDHEITINAGNFTEVGEFNAYYIWCNTSAEGGELRGIYEITTNGRTTPDGIVILGFAILLLAILIFSIIYMIKAVGLMVEGNFDLLDVAYMWGLYFGLLGALQLSNIYLGNFEVQSWLNLFVTIYGFPMILVPVFAFILSMFRQKKRKEKERNKW